MGEKQFKVNAIDLACPMPLLKLKQALNQIEIGEEVYLVATDPTSKRDFFSYINMTNHQIKLKEMNNEFHYFVTKG